MILSKVCRDCGLDQPLTDYYTHTRMLDGRLNKCKTCVKGRVKKHRGENLERIQEYDRNRPNAEERKKSDVVRNKARYDRDPAKAQLSKKSSREKHPLHNKARRALSNAIRDGRVYRPDHCAHCGKHCTPDGHHHSYEEPYWLDVLWLCKPCHGLEHKRINEVNRKLNKK